MKLLIPILSLLLAGCASSQKSEAGSQRPEARGQTSDLRPPSTPDLNPYHATASSRPPQIIQLMSSAQVAPTPATITPSLIIASASWTAVSNAASYALCYGPESQRYDSIIRTDSTNCTVNLIAGATYYFSVVGVDTDNFGGDFSRETAATMPQSYDLLFPDPGTALESSTDLANWSSRDAGLTNGVWTVAGSNGVPQEFYRQIQ